MLVLFKTCYQRLNNCFEAFITIPICKTSIPVKFDQNQQIKSTVY